jgi:hypothetical protein
MSLEKISLGYSPLSDTIYLYRHGKDPALSLEKREFKSEVIGVVVSMLMHDAEHGSSMTVSSENGDMFEITCKPVEK